MTLTVEDLGLTPKQAAELNLADPGLVTAWLEALSLNHGLKSPTGWFLAGVRSGESPAGVSDARQRHAIQRAETLVRNVGALIEDERELLETLFSPQELTADVETLERVEMETRGHPGREWFGPALEAQLAFTRTHGRQVIEATGGPLAKWDTPVLRARMVAMWRREHPKAETVAPVADPADAPIDWAAA